MAIARLHSYIPGQLARGDHVQPEFDQLISQVNLLDANKLSTNGGTVVNLTVAGNLVGQGSSIFNAGIQVKNQPAVFNRGIQAPTSPVPSQLGGWLWDATGQQVSTVGTGFGQVRFNNSLDVDNRGIFNNSGFDVSSTLPTPFTRTKVTSEGRYIRIDSFNSSHVNTNQAYLMIDGELSSSLTKIEMGLNTDALGMPSFVRTNRVLINQLGLVLSNGATPIVEVRRAGSQSHVYFQGLPTSDPGVQGRVWNDSGTLKISL